MARFFRDKGWGRRNQEEESKGGTRTEIAIPRLVGMAKKRVVKDVRGAKERYGRYTKRKKEGKGFKQDDRQPRMHALNPVKRHSKEIREEM